jgi:hypothetical protein
MKWVAAKKYLREQTTVQLDQKLQVEPLQRVHVALGFDEDDGVEIAETPCQ